MPNSGRIADFAGAGKIPPCDVLAPPRQSTAVVYASPHSGAYYPADFVANAALDPLTLRRSEDSFVDEIFAAAPRFGSPLMRARYARVYIDVNREPYELDPAMFDEALPPHTNTTSLRVAGGLGTIARVVADGAEVYRGKLTYAEAEDRVRAVYRPYHDALAGLLEQTRSHFGHAILIDCHSMPSTGGPLEREGGRRRADIVLGDRYGTACAPEIIDLVQGVLTHLGYVVARNTPYAGGFTTYHYGRPAQAMHALQIEINRNLYMDEQTIERTSGLALLAGHMGALMRALAAFDLGGALAAE